jgi:hypothetical protein
VKYHGGGRRTKRKTLVIDFQAMVKDKIEMLGVLHSNVYNVDQTNILLLNGVKLYLGAKGF